MCDYDLIVCTMALYGLIEIRLGYNSGIIIIISSLKIFIMG